MRIISIWAVLIYSAITAGAQGLAIYKGGIFQFYAMSDIDSILILKETPENMISVDRQGVDLGLTSGTLWGACNIGAYSPEQYGKYYAWGELMEKEIYSEDSYHFTNTADVQRRIFAEEDVACKTLGKGWRMPTREHFQELMDECTWSWEKYRGVQGCRVTGPNNNSIFLPAGTFKETYFSMVPDTATYGSYWGRERDRYYPNSHGYPCATELTFGVVNLRKPAINGNFYYEFGVSGLCHCGRNIRPVYDTTIEIPPVLLPSNKWSGTCYSAMAISYDSGIDYGTMSENNPHYNIIVGTPAVDEDERAWFDVDYSPTNDNRSTWQEVQAPFTNWCSNYGDIYLRREFVYDYPLPERLFLACGHDDAPCEYYLNGELIWSVQDGWNQDEVIELSPSQIALLRQGAKNVLACHVHQNWGGMYADCGLYTFRPARQSR